MWTGICVHKFISHHWSSEEVYYSIALALKNISLKSFYPDEVENHL